MTALFRIWLAMFIVTGIAFTLAVTICTYTWLTHRRNKKRRHRR